MSALIANPFHLQIALGLGLCGLAFLSVLRPDLGLAVSGMGMVLAGAVLYAELGPTSPQLTTAAVYLVGGLLAAGLAGIVRLRAAQAQAAPRAASAAGRSEWRSDFLDDILDAPVLARDEGAIGDYFRGADRPEPRRPYSRPMSPRRPAPATEPRPRAWS